ncbi:MAG: MarR family transcriptional regulator [bacterium]|nr:MarR family transcriptional regulator [bacterium]
MMIPDFYQSIDNLNFGDITSGPFLLGLLSAFNNRYQVVADASIGEITWKQFFAIVCINLCEESPTLNELADIMGSSHQNVKQILLKLSKKGFVQIVPDEKDRRKQRVIVTDKCRAFCNDSDEKSHQLINQIFRDIPEEELAITIKTISQMERNLYTL